MPNDPHDHMLPPLVEDHEEEAFKQDVDSGMVAMVYLCVILFFTLLGIVIYFLISAESTI